MNYLHPDDEAYAFPGRYLCSPSLVRHPDGFLPASMDVYAAAHPQNLTLIFRSDDEGTTWHYVSELTLCYRVNTDDPDAPLAYDRCIPFDGNFSKFTIRYDAPSDRYYTIATRVYEAEKPRARNLLSLMVSDDLDHWRVACDLHDWRDHDPQLIGFQYVDFIIEGDDLLYLCRTAINGAHNFHDANYSTFHRIRHFRAL